MRLDKKNQTVFSSMREILFSSIPEIGQNTMPLHQRINFYWNLTVGPKIASVSRVQRLENKTLHIEVEDDGWKMALHPLKKKILEEINQRDYKIQISKIVIKKSEIPFSLQI